MSLELLPFGPGVNELDSLKSAFQIINKNFMELYGLQVEFYTNSKSFPAVGTAGIVYHDLEAGTQHKWGGSAYELAILPTSNRPLMLLPSGGDDGPAIFSMCLANRGLVLLGPGVFKINSYTLLYSSINHILGTTFMGPQLIGCGEGVTVIDTSGYVQPCYQKIEIVSVSASSSPVFTLASGEGVKLANDDILRVETISGMLQANQSDHKVSSLVGDSFTSVAQGETTAGFPAWTQSTHNYAKKYITSNPVFRVVPPISSGTTRYNQQHDVLVQGITFKGLSDVSGNTKRTQRLFAFETDEAPGTAGGVTLDTRITHKAVFRNVQAYGYECVIHCDDVTNMTLDNCDMKGNAAVVWAGYNSDIYTFFQTLIGDDYGIPNTGRGVGIINAPAIFADGNTPGVNSFMLDSCWVLNAENAFQVNGVSGSVTFKNCYFEQIKKIADLGNGYSAAFEGCKFTSFSDSGYVRPSVKAIGNTVKSRITFRECSGASGVGPNYGFIDVTPDATRERYWPNVLWENNSLGYAAGKGQIRSGSVYIALSDNHDTVGGTYADQNQGGGLYYFEGPIQTGGHERVQEIASVAGALTPNLLNGTTVWVTSLQENTTVAAPSNQPALSAAFALRRMLPLRFVIKQDGTGGRTLTWNAIFKFHTAFTQAVVTTDANKTTEVEFRWDGSAWRQSSPANVWL